MKWRVIPVQERDAFTNMAMDEAISESISAGRAEPTIRFYTWQPSAVSIGYFQCLEREVNLGECEKQGVDVVRRRTGGGAVYHDTEGEITYSVIGPEKLFPKGIIDSYKLICGWVIAGLEKTGLNAEFHPINDILVGGKKVSGNAQTRRGGILLQHGTILYDVNLEKMFSLLNVSAVKISDKMIASAKERVTCVKDHADIKRAALEKALLDGFTDGKDFFTGDYSKDEQKRAAELAKERYCSNEWLNLR